MSRSKLTTRLPFIPAVETFTAVPLAATPSTTKKPRTGGSNWPTDPCVMDTLRASRRFTTFVRLLESSGLAREIRRRDAVTVFAPNDEAFARMSPRAVSRLIDDRKILRRLLRRHILFGRHPLTGRGKVKHPWLLITGLAGQVCEEAQVTCTDASGQCAVGSPPVANIVRADIKTCNGFVNELDHVLFRALPDPSL